MIFINHLISYKFHLFADDTSIFYSHKNLKNVEMTLNNELIKVSEWLIANKLTLNVSKSNFVIFHPPLKKIHMNITLYINDEKLEEKQFTKYLGVLIDKHLTLETTHTICKSQDIKRYRIISQTSTLRTQKYTKNFILCIYPTPCRLWLVKLGMC